MVLPNTDRYCRSKLPDCRSSTVPVVVGDRVVVGHHATYAFVLRATMRNPLRSPAQVEGTQGFLPQPEKDLERPSSTRLEARFPYHGSGAVTRSPSPLAWRPDFPGAPREASLTSPSYLVRNCTLGPPLENNPGTPL